MYINTVSYSSQMDEICIHTTNPGGASTETGCTTPDVTAHKQRLFIFYSLHYHLLKLVILNYESEECSLSGTRLLTILPFAANETAVTYMHKILLCTVILLEKL
jgi:hypothetical protein